MLKKLPKQSNRDNLIRQKEMRKHAFPEIEETMDKWLKKVSNTKNETVDGTAIGVKQKNFLSC